jgi:hypothetical protein
MCLQDVFDRLHIVSEGPRAPVVILDLDSTLVDTGPRHLAILQAFGESHGIDVTSVLRHYRDVPVGWSVDPGLVAAGWPDDRVAAFHRFWSERFFDGRWVGHDRAAPGAVSLVRRIVDAGAIACYLTGRPSPTMGPGTIASLLSLGFPVLRSCTPLHMKPSPHLSDERFKRAALAEIGRLGVVVAAFDNEPAHVNAMKQAFPDAHCVLVGDVRSPDAPAPAPGTLAVPDLHLR